MGSLDGGAWGYRTSAVHLGLTFFWVLLDCDILIGTFSLRFLDALASLDLKLSVSGSFTFFRFSVNDVM